MLKSFTRANQQETQDVSFHEWNGHIVADSKKPKRDGIGDLVGFRLRKSRQFIGPHHLLLNTPLLRREIVCAS
ncbi:hypothetical protein WN943_004188 [Citrus x changshan-huyou]